MFCDGLMTTTICQSRGSIGCAVIIEWEKDSYMSFVVGPGVIVHINEGLAMYR